MEKKELKDYLHLYLGCDVQTNIPGKSTSIGVIRLDKHPIDAEAYVRIMDWLRLDDDNESYVKPILRPLSDMTEEEEKEMELTQSECKLEGYPEITLKVDEGETFRYMLSKHFDLFGLIEAGLAIDSTTFKPTHQ